MNIPCRYYLDYWWVYSPKAATNSYDLNTVLNHDYFISNRGFFWDLCNASEALQKVRVDVVTKISVIQTSSLMLLLMMIRLSRWEPIFARFR